MIMQANKAFTVTEEVCKRNHISLAEVLFLTSLVYEPKFQETIKSLTDKGYLVLKTQGEIDSDGLSLDLTGVDIINAVVAESQIIGTDKARAVQEDKLLNLAMQLKEIFPKGRKEGTTKQWSDSTRTIVHRLLLFFKQYGEYTDEQILTAAKSYVQGFNGDYSYMHTLRYFIFKNEVIDGMVDKKSELLTYIENAGQEDTLRNDWTSELV